MGAAAWTQTFRQVVLKKSKNFSPILMSPFSGFLIFRSHADTADWMGIWCKGSQAINWSLKWAVGQSIRYYLWRIFEYETLDSEQLILGKNHRETSRKRPELKLWVSRVWGQEESKGHFFSGRDVDNRRKDGEAGFKAWWSSRIETCSSCSRGRVESTQLPDSHRTPYYLPTTKQCSGPWGG